jgi:hypothetical protein
MGGVQRIYTGNIRTGEHELGVFVLGKAGPGADFEKSRQFTVTKSVGPRFVEISLDGQTISLSDR